MASQNVTLSGQQTPYINDLLEELFTNDQLEKWPFAENVDFIDCSADIPQPKTDVRVTFSSLHQRCHSLLVELKPWALVVNHSGIDLVLKRVNDSAGCWTLPNRAVMAPPPMNDDTFQIGFIEDGQLDSVFYSQPLLLQDQDHFHFMYRPRVEGAIPLEGFCTVQITKSNGAMCYLTLTSRMHEGIRILSIQPTFRIHNATPSLLKIGCLIGDSLLACKATLVEPKDESRAIPLLFWQSTGKHSESLYLSIRLCSDWSCPIQLYHPGHSSRNSNSHHINPQRYSVSVPLSCGSLESETSDNCPLVITRLEQSGLVYLSVNVDPDPLWVLINRTELTLAYGQASDSVPGHPEPDCPTFNWHGVIRSNEAAFYTPPWGQLRYTDVSPPVNLPRLLLALEETSPKWSNPVHPSHTYDQFLCLSPSIDVMVRMVRTSTPNQTAIYIEPVSRVEISASDIRGRIEIPPPVAPPSPVQDVTIRPPRPALRSPCKTENECKVLHDLAGNQLVRITNAVSEEKDLNLTVYWPEISVCFRDDTTAQRREMSRLTVDHFLVDYFQNSSVRRITSRCGHVQMDNQLYQPQSNALEARSRDEEVQGFDFPVIFLAQNPPTWQQKSLAKLLDALRQSALVVLELGLTDSGRPTSLDFQLDPIFLFIEDRFIVAAMDYLNTFSFSTPTLKKGSNQSSELVSFPDRVAEALSSLSVSVNLDQLKVHPISLDLSLRSSVKLYIALDHSPLRLDAFERSLVLTTPYRLGQTLAMHYVSSALFKAGWVVGSMELLGSPTALARTVTLGLKDFVRLPYQGIWRGPRGFLAGIFNGSASLVSHVTAGTVTSVTQLASSVARNVDRLSFDLDFQQRSEEGRRKKPQGNYFAIYLFCGDVR
jgi:vacuolar protein sorting-associated protein 13B